MSDLNEENKQIKFPKQHYIGMIGRAHDVLPLGFMTEDGTDKAALKRKATVDSWTTGNVRHGQEKTINIARSYENVPLIGFRLTKSIRRYSSWGSGNVKWRIEDPRGFELEITSPNMARIVDTCVIDQGEILEECIWARLKGDNILVPVSSDLYIAATRNDERMTSKVKPSEVNRGDRVTLQNGDEGIYLGKFECMTPYYGRDERLLFSYQWKNKPVHAMVMETKNHAGELSLYVKTFSTFKPSYRVAREGGPLTPEEAQALAAAHSQRYGYRSEWLSLTKPPVEYKETDVTLADYMTNEESHGDEKLVCMQGDVMYSVYCPKYVYDSYLAVLAGTPNPYHRSHDAQISRISRDGDGHYIVHANRSNYSSTPYGLKVEELVKLPLKLISASITLNDGSIQRLR